MGRSKMDSYDAGRKDGINEGADSAMFFCVETFSAGGGIHPDLVRLSLIRKIVKDLESGLAAEKEDPLSEDHPCGAGVRPMLVTILADLFKITPGAAHNVLSAIEDAKRSAWVHQKEIRERLGDGGVKKAA